MQSTKSFWLKTIEKFSSFVLEEKPETEETKICESIEKSTEKSIE